MHKFLSLKKNFSWSLCGNLVYTACQWGNLIILTKLTSPEVVGAFGLASAVCIPIIMFTNLALRQLQVIDVKEEYEFGHYMALRLLLILASLVLIAAVCLVVGHKGKMLLLTMLLGVGYCITSIREIFHAVMQKAERMDYIAIAQITLGFLTILALGTLVWLTGELIVGILGMVAMRVMVMFFWDMKVAARFVNKHDGISLGYYVLKPKFQFKTLLALFLLAFPLGITVALISLRNSVVPYFIEFSLNREAVGYFIALASLPLAALLPIQSLAASICPRLARYYQTNYRAFIKLLAKAITIGIVLGLAGLLIAVVMGKGLLTLLFEEKYASYNKLFIWLMLYTTVLFVAIFLGYGMSAARCFKPQVVVMSVSVIATCFACWLLIPQYALTGAAWSCAVGSMAQVLGSLVVLFRDYRKSHRVAVRQ
jgi:O-antigen/teichoic acid export membrane protein